MSGKKCQKNSAEAFDSSLKRSRIDDKKAINFLKNLKNKSSDSPDAVITKLSESWPSAVVECKQILKKPTEAPPAPEKVEKPESLNAQSSHTLPFGEPLNPKNKELASTYIEFVEKARNIVSDKEEFNKTELLDLLSQSITVANQILCFSYKKEETQAELKKRSLSQFDKQVLATESSLKDETETMAPPSKNHRPFHPALISLPHYSAFLPHNPVIFNKPQRITPTNRSMPELSHHVNSSDPKNGGSEGRNIQNIPAFNPMPPKMEPTAVNYGSLNNYMRMYASGNPPSFFPFANGTRPQPARRLALKLELKEDSGSANNNTN